MGLEYNIFTGHLHDAYEYLSRSLAQFASGGNEIKVGVTADPETRWSSHGRNGFNRMVVKYETSSYSYAVQLEKWLIEQSHRLGYHSLNVNPGGEGFHQDEYRYYLYFLM